MGKITVSERSLRYERRDETILIEPYGENCIRVRATRNRTFSGNRWTLAEPADCQVETISQAAHKASLRNGRLMAEIDIGTGWPKLDIVFYDLVSGRKLLKNKEEGDYVSCWKHISGNLYQVKAVFESRSEEHFYGLGQEQQDYFDRKGCSSELCHRNTKASIPVLYSSLGYGFIWNNPSPGRCETTKNHTLWASYAACQIDYLVFTGEDPAEIMYRYCTLTGFPSRLPEWALGFWQSKLRYESQRELLEVAGKYHQMNIPLSAIVIDYFHWTEQGEWKFDPKYWPDPASMVEELKQMGIETVVSIWPTINPSSCNYHEMSEENMLVTNEYGQYGMFDFYGQQAFIDPTNPKTAKYVWDIIKENYYRYGIHSFWLDEAEPEVHPQQFENLRFFLGNGAETALLYPYYYAKMFFDGLTEAGEKEVALLIRAAYIGSQKFGTCVWNGDIPSTFEALRQSIASGLSMSVCGIPWWNSDIGGFHDADTESDYFRELILRWFQFGLFSPIMRLHGDRKRQSYLPPENEKVKEASGGDNEVWSFGEKNYPVLCEYIKLREKLKPFLIAAMDENCASGAPIAQPLFFRFPDDPICFEIDDEYMFCKDILFAPIFQQGKTSRWIYLPSLKDEDNHREYYWILTKDRSRYKNGYLEIEAKPEEFIAFIPEYREDLRQVFE